MKLKLLALGSITVGTVLAFTPAFIQKANAVCMNTRVGIQVGIHSGTANQRQNANQRISKDCSNNQSTVTGTQVYSGPGSVNQNMNSNQSLSGGKRKSGAPMPNINTNVGVTVDVPAYPKKP